MNVYPEVRRPFSERYHKIFSRVVWLYIIIAGLETLLCVRAYLFMPSESKNNMLFGFSLPKLLATSGLFLVFLICILIIYDFWRHKDRTEKIFSWLSGHKTVVDVLFFSSLFLGLIGFWIIYHGVSWVDPFRRVREWKWLYLYYQIYSPHLEPVVVLITLICVQTLLIFFPLTLGLFFSRPMTLGLFFFSRPNVLKFCFLSWMFGVLFIYGIMFARWELWVLLAEWGLDGPLRIPQSWLYDFFWTYKVGPQ